MERGCVAETSRRIVGCAAADSAARDAAALRENAWNLAAVAFPLARHLPHHRATIVGNQFCVTNSPASSALFYRLREN